MGVIPLFLYGLLDAGLMVMRSLWRGGCAARNPFMWKCLYV